MNLQTTYSDGPPSQTEGTSSALHDTQLAPYNTWWASPFTTLLVILSWMQHLAGLTWANFTPILLAETVCWAIIGGFLGEENALCAYTMVVYAIQQVRTSARSYP